MPSAKPKTRKLETVKVRAVENIPTFMGVDAKIYKLKKGNVVKLPKVNAELLVTHGVAEITQARVNAKACDVPANTVYKKLPTAPTGKIKKEITLSAHDKALLSGNFKIEYGGKLKVPSCCELQQTITGKGGQAHLKTVGVNVPKIKVPKTKNKKKKRRVKSKDLTPFGIPKAGQKILVF